MSGRQKSIIIKVGQDGFYLSPSLFIPMQQTNLPWAHFSFKTNHSIYWEVIMLQYDSIAKSLQVEVEDYEADDPTAFASQIPKKDVQFLKFEKLNWRIWQNQLSSYQKHMLGHIIFNQDQLTVTPAIRETKKTDDIVFDNDPYYDDSLPEVDETERYEWKESFWVTFSEAQIALGYVSFQKYINRVERVLEFRIYNHHLLPEFNIIRHWFAKKLGTKRFYVNAIIMLEVHAVTDIKATSTQIDQIGPGLIDSIKYQRVHGLTREPNVQLPDKSLFTADEMFGMLDDDDEQGNIFNQSEEEILAMLLEKTNIRNKKHLAYLAGSKQSQGVKLKYTLHPHFGFLFFVEGEQCHHFIWELLNSHATYVWSIDKNNKSIDLQWQRIERTINTIRSAGRDAYKRSYQEQHTDKDLVFHFIPHEDIDSKFVDGFPKWRERLNEQLV